MTRHHEDDGQGRPTNETGLHPADARDARRRAVRRSRLAVRGQVGRLPGRGRRRRRDASGCGPAGEQDAARYFGPFLDPPTWIGARQAVVDGEVIALDDRGRARLRAAPGADQGRGAWPPSRTRSSTRSSTCSTSTAGRSSTSRSRSAAGSWRRSCAPDPRVRLSEHIEARRDRVLRGGPDARPRGDHGQGPPLAVRARQAHRPLAEGQDPPRAGARRRRLGDGHRHGGRPRRAPRRRLRGRRAALRRQGRRRVHGRPAAPSCWPRSRRSRPTASPFAPPPPEAPPRATPSGSAPSSSSAPSSRAGPATASSARPPTRASSSRRTRARSSASARRPERSCRVRRMGRLVVTEFMTVDGVMEAPGFDEHRSGRNAWALRLSDDDMQVFNRDQLRDARRAPVRPHHVPDLGGVLAIPQGRGVVRPAGERAAQVRRLEVARPARTGTTRRSCAAIRPRRPRRSRPGSTASSSSTGARTSSRR